MVAQVSAEAVPWESLAADAGTRARYAEYVYRRGGGRCSFWLGSISDSGHPKLRAGSRASGSSRVVSAHVLGWVIEYGADALGPDVVVRHRCDEASCVLPAHWLLGTRLENNREARARRLPGHPLADVRGAAGRAVAIRDAIKAARAAGAGVEAVEAAIAAAMAAGVAGGAVQEGLW